MHFERKLYLNEIKLILFLLLLVKSFSYIFSIIIIIYNKNKMCNNDNNTTTFMCFIIKNITRLRSPIQFQEYLRILFILFSKLLMKLVRYKRSNKIFTEKI